MLVDEIVWKISLPLLTYISDTPAYWNEMRELKKRNNSIYESTIYHLTFCLTFIWFGCVIPFIHIIFCCSLCHWFAMVEQLLTMLICFYFLLFVSVCVSSFNFIGTFKFYLRLRHRVLFLQNEERNGWKREANIQMKRAISCHR